MDSAFISRPLFFEFRIILRVPILFGDLLSGRLRPPTVLNTDRLVPSYKSYIVRQGINENYTSGCLISVRERGNEHFVKLTEKNLEIKVTCTCEANAEW